MISTREEYDFVTIEDGLIVKGDVYGARMHAQGSLGVLNLRAEDAAFGLEAACERMYTCNYITEQEREKYHVDKVIRGYPLTSAAQYIHDVKNRVVVMPMEMKPMLVDHVTIPPQSLFDVYNFGYRYRPLSEPRDFYSGQPVAIAPIRRLYYDLEHMRCFDGFRSSVADYGAYSTTKGGTYKFSLHANGLRLLTHQAITTPIPSVGTRSAYGYEQALASEGDIHFGDSYPGIAGATLRLKYVKRMYLVLAVHVYYGLFMSEQTVLDKDYYLPTLMEVKDGDVRLSRSSLAAGIRTMIENDVGHIYTDEDMEVPAVGTSNYSFSLYAEIKDRGYAICELGDHTKF